LNKYRNHKTVTLDGEVFDSQREARRYSTLKLLEKCGAISDLKRQVVFELLPAQREECFDTYKKGKPVVEDVKGMRTKDYIIKRKMMLYFHGIKIREE
jgi:hypothetical protein